VRRRLEPLRVRPFGRLLGSYTVNDLGDTIGVIALSILVFDQTDAVAPTAGFFLFAKFLPALLATLKREADPARPVPMIMVGLGADADMDALRQIAEATGGKAYQAMEPEDIRGVLLDGISQRRCRPNC